MEIYCVHGFLGNPEDWGFLHDVCDEKGWRLHAVSCWSFFSEGAISLQDAAKKFCADVAKDSVAPRLLLGYSMGGRFGLHALLEAPHLWARALIVSAHYGLEQEEARAARRLHDAKWAARFRLEPWDDLMLAWNAQGVFGGLLEQRSLRKEEDFEREKLALALEAWSLGTQAFLLPKLQEVRDVLSWLVGAQDTKFCALTQREEFRALGLDSHVWEGVGHRVPWEASERFVRWLVEWACAAERAGWAERAGAAERAGTEARPR
ncbi:MAG: alpha/beta fold hydrolase [Myxococcales bacterium]|nr:alpha/beta fold hydrolase [Myxococcales bacterium]